MRKVNEMAVDRGSCIIVGAGAQQPAMIGWLMRGYRPLNIVFEPGPQVAARNTGGDR